MHALGAGLPSEGCMPGGCAFSGRGACPGGGGGVFILPMHAPHLSPVNRMTHTWVNITFPELRLRAVKINNDHNLNNYKPFPSRKIWKRY